MELARTPPLCGDSSLVLFQRKRATKRPSLKLFFVFAGGFSPHSPLCEKDALRAVPAKDYLPSKDAFFFFARDESRETSLRAPFM